MPFEEDGTILLNILESLGSSTDQLTEPPELPVSGDPGKFHAFLNTYYFTTFHVFQYIDATSYIKSRQFEFFRN